MKEFMTDNLGKLRLFAMLFVVLAFVSCSDDDTSNPTPVNQAEVLVNYLEANGDFINTAAPAIVNAEAVRTEITGGGSIYVIDIRDTATFNKGHIPGAHNVPVFADILTHVKSINAAQYGKIVIACFSGQSAAYAASLLRLAGYNNVYSMKWGMASWHSDFSATWSGKISNAKATEFETKDNPKLTPGTLPTLNTPYSSGSEILMNRVDSLFKKGYGEASITNTTLYTDLSKYYIINYWPAAQYTDPGHIAGSIQYTPKADLKSAAFLKTLPTNKTIVVYCYTGQTSSYIAAYLRLLGYDAKSLSFGANALIYDLMVGKAGFTAWADSEVKNYDLEK